MKFFSIVMKKGIEHLNVLNAKEGMIEEMNGRVELQSLMKIHSKDPERGEVLVNRRVLLSGETEPDQRSFFCTR